MFYEPKEITLKNGKTAIFRGPWEEDAAQLLAFMKATARETPYLLRMPEECTMTVEQEVEYLRGLLQSPWDAMILCEVDGEIAGNCRFSRKTKRKNTHRATTGIAILQKFWGMGIGSAMFDALIQLGREVGVEQLELEVFEGNERALALYTGKGFRIVGEIPNAIRQKDGTTHKEYYMVKELL